MFFLDFSARNCSSSTFPPVIEISFSICCVTRRTLHASSLSECKLLSALLRSQDISFNKEGGPHQRPMVFTRPQLHIRAAPRSKHHGYHPRSSRRCVPLRWSSPSCHVDPVSLLPHLLYDCEYLSLGVIFRVNHTYLLSPPFPLYVLPNTLFLAHSVFPHNVTRVVSRLRPAAIVVGDHPLRGQIPLLSQHRRLHHRK